MSDLLQVAVNALRIEDVSFRSSTCHISEDYDPKYDPRSENVAFQLKNVVQRTEIIELESDEEDIKLFRVMIGLGVRISTPEGIDENPQDPDLLAYIEADLCADYRIEDESIVNTPDALEIFAFRNARFNAWPYWREFVSNQCQRTNLPKIILPFMMKPED